MNRDEIIEELQKYFSIKEIVCPHVYGKYGERSWMFLTTEFLHTLLVLRTKILKVPLICNSYSSGLTQRGLRCNLCDIVKQKTVNDILYMSAHHNGMGGDLTSPQMTAKEMRRRIQINEDMLPYPVRLEGDVSWLHIDCYDEGNPYKVTIFKP